MATTIEVIEAYREIQKWTRQQMAHKLGLPSSNYSDMVSGKRQVPTKAIKKAHALGIPADLLLEGSDE